MLVHTGRDEFYDQLDYIARGPGVTAAATRWLYERGRPRDGHRRLGLGPPAAPPGPGSGGEGRAGIFWEAHQCDLQYSQIERLVNLAALPPTGFR